MALEDGRFEIGRVARPDGFDEVREVVFGSAFESADESAFSVE